MSDSAMAAECRELQEQEIEALETILGEGTLRVTRGDGAESPSVLEIEITVQLPEGHMLDLIGPHSPSLRIVDGCVTGARAGGGHGVCEGTVDDAPGPFEAWPGSPSEGTSPVRPSPRRQRPFVTVKHLSPVTLRVTLPPLYPLASPPDLTLCCLWLDEKRISSVRARLLELWDTTYQGSQVIYSWMDWLEAEVLDLVVGAKMGLELEGRPPPLSEDDDGTWEQRLMKVLAYTYNKENEIWRNDSHTCLVCFDEFLGRDMVLLRCGCYWCRECLSTNTVTHIDDGDVHNITCPNPECGSELTPEVIQELVTQDKFARWEQLLLSKTLDRMADCAYCPRCQTAVLREGDRLGQCTRCFFAFCFKCKEPYHVGPCPDAFTKMEEIEEQIRRLGASEKLAATRNAEIEKLRRLAEDNLSKKALQQARCCPACSAPVEKTEGCNKMRCYCGCYFCHRCGKDITDVGYAHFNKGCNLWDVAEVERWNRQMNQPRNLQQEMLGVARANGVEHVRLVPCPGCRSHNILLDRNNHVRCHACTRQFCAACRQLFTKAGSHFSGPGRCKQHADI